MADAILACVCIVRVEKQKNRATILENWNNQQKKKQWDSLITN